MALVRILEEEYMDTDALAQAYHAMDHHTVNSRFVTDLLTALVTHFPQVDLTASPDWSLLEAAESTDESPQVFDVLDLGTGTALIPVGLCQATKVVRIMAVDAAASMLEIAQAAVDMASLRERILLQQGDAKELAFEDEMFDLVMTNTILHHIPEPLDLLREAWRVTKPGGLLFMRDLFRPDNQADLEMLVAAQNFSEEEKKLCESMFAESLQAALTLEEIRALVMTFGCDSETVQLTSDRHWTWAAMKPLIL